MKTSTLTKLAATAMLILGVTAPQAAILNLDGVIIDTNSPVNFEAKSNIRETLVLAVGDELSGYGNLTELNGTSNAVFCPGCELTFTFSDFIVDYVEGNIVTFTGGLLNLYVDSTPNFNAFVPATAGDGNLWLSLAAVDHTRIGFDDALSNPLVASLFSTINGTLANPENGSAGFSLFDVIGGPFAQYFDTNTIVNPLGGFADFSFSSSFQFAGGPDGFLYPISGTGEVQGFVTAVPEPGSLALLAIGFLAAGVATRRRSVKSALAA